VVGQFRAGDREAGAEQARDALVHRIERIGKAGRRLASRRAPAAETDDSEAAA
jgi:hypothetical protein